VSLLKILDHPLIKHKLTHIRNKQTNSKEFREIVRELGALMAFEVTRNLPTVDVEIETPLEKMNSPIIGGPAMAIVPILRAGLGMADGILNLIPNACVGHVGMFRDPHTHKPIEYYCKLPDRMEERECMVVDPMLATGGSAVAAITLLKQKGARKIKLVCLIGSPEGVELVRNIHPDTEIYLAELDRELDDKAFILPGLGDAGDRLYGTY
jgi:uracil phosphoribosyltransferase